MTESADEKLDRIEKRVIALLQERDEALALAAALREALEEYAGQYCEGWCKENGGYFDDCGGCAARQALALPLPTALTDLEARIRADEREKCAEIAASKAREFALRGNAHERVGAMGAEEAIRQRAQEG